jgi:hypothetical protein
VPSTSVFNGGVTCDGASPPSAPAVALFMTAWVFRGYMPILGDSLVSMP